MSELKSLLAEAKSSLQDLENLLKRVRSLDRNVSDPYLPRPEQIKCYADEVLKIMERIPANLILEEKRRREGVVEQLQSEMEQVRHRVEGAVEKLEAACERNVTQFADFIDNLQQRIVTTTNQETHGLLPMSQLNELLTKGKDLLENRDYEACMQAMNEALHVAPNNLEAASCMEEAQRKWEDQRLEEELVVHIDNIKKEATDLFDQEKYRECVGMFKFLCELEPKNRTLQDYLELSQQRVQELEESETRRQTAQDPPVWTDSANRSADRSNSHSVEPEATSPTGSEGNLPHQSSPSGFEARAVSAPLPSDAARGEEAEPANSGKHLIAVFVGLSVLVGVLVGVLLLRSRSAQLRNVEPPPSAPLVVDSPTQPPVEPSNLGQETTILSQEATTDQLHQQATELFDRSRWLEASRLCDDILEKNPQNGPAKELKGKIRTHFWRQSQQAKSRKRESEWRKALENLLKVFPGDTAALKELKTLKVSGSVKEAPPDPEIGVRTRIEDLHRQIAAAMSAGSYFPPASGNAWTLIQRLGTLSPADPVFREKMDQIHREAISQLQRRIQTKDTEGARALARQLQEYFPASAELRSLRESLRTDDTQQHEARSSLTQKLDAALAQGRYVTPANDNALAYCNRLLALEAQNEKAQAQKREIFTKAAVQAKDFTQNEKFDEARDVLSALLAFGQNEGRTSVVQEAKAQLNKLEFTSYPVIHDHALGSCSGRLRMNAYVISYIPSGDSKDGFSQRLTDAVETEPGDKLKLQLKGKTYRFQPNLVKGKEETRQKVQEMHLKLTELIARAK